MGFGERQEKLYFTLLVVWFRACSSLFAFIVESVTIEELTRAKQCSVCSELKRVEEFPPASGRCKTCRRKGWVPPNYLDQAPVVQSVKFGPPPWRYPLTVHQQRLLREAQHFRCAICHERSERLVVDHCHTSEYVRGLLCQGCNQGLGFFKDKPEVMRAAAAYIEQPTLPSGPKE